MGKKHEAVPPKSPLETPTPVRAMRDRVYENVSVDDIVVTNSRSRDPRQFADPGYLLS